MMKRKVYDIHLKKFEPFIFYAREGKLTNICNRKYPRPHIGRNLCGPDGTFTKIDNPNINIESVIFPYIKNIFNNLKLGEK